MVFVTCGVDTAYGFYIFQMVGILRAMSLECEKVGKSSDEFDIILLRNCIKKEILRLFMFIIYRKQFYELHSTLELMHNEVLENVQFRPIVLSTINLFRYPAYMVYYLILSTMSLYIFASIIIIGYEGIKDIQLKHYGLPFLTNFPWINGTPGIIYQIQFLFETQCIWFIAFFTGGVDSSYGFYIFQMIGLMRAMSFECKNAFKSSYELKNILHNCIKKQVRLLRCRDIIQQIYGPIVLDLMLTNAIVLCALIFQAFQRRGKNDGANLVLSFLQRYEEYEVDKAQFY
ncbi:hypothetical protein M0804_015351 [Polistes exclamans]|nr:hypothetical protein M0804_015351 [Polistes exclamans]